MSDISKNLLRPISWFWLFLQQNDSSMWCSMVSAMAFTETVWLAFGQYMKILSGVYYKVHPYLQVIMRKYFFSLGFFNKFAHYSQENWRRKQKICVFEKHINRTDLSLRLPYLFHFTLSAKYECESWQTKHQLFARMHWVKEATFYRPPMFPSCSEVKNKIIGKEILFLSYFQAIQFANYFPYSKIQKLLEI